MSGTQTRYANKDASMGKIFSSGFSGWNGKDDHLIVGVNVGGNVRYRTVIGFNIDFSPMLAIESAILTLYETNDNTFHVNQTHSNPVLVNRMTADWGEGGSDPGDGNLTGTFDWEWNNRFDAYASGGQATHTVTMGSSGNTDTWDVTTIVTSWFNGSPNYGFMVRNSDDSTAGDSQYAAQFWARTAPNDAYKPKLVITYTTNIAPSAPTLTAPIGAAIVSTTTPTFEGTRVDSDTGDYITGVQIQVASPNHKRFRFSTSTSTAPGSGYIRVNSLTEPTSVYINETDYDSGSAVAFLTSIATKHIRIYNAAGSVYVDGTIGTVTDSGTWETLPITSVTVYTANQPANDEVSIIEIDALADYSSGSMLWDSGYIAIAGAPTQFSIIYGSAGSASTLSSSTFYKWRAKTYDKGGLPSTAWTNYQYFKPNNQPNQPTLVFNEAPTSDIPTLTPTFSITHNDIDPLDTKMYAYQLVIEKETSVGAGDWTTIGGYDTGVVDTSSSLATTNSVTSGSLSWGGSFRVKARTKDSASLWSPYSASQTFIVHKAVVPNRLNPTGNEGVSATPTFTGYRASYTDTILAYTIAVYNSSMAAMLSPTRYTTGTDGDSFSRAYAGSALTPGQTYSWQVLMESWTGGTADWSPLQYFTVVDATVASVIAPIGQLAGGTLTPTITIDRATSFTSVHYEIYNAINPANGLPTSSTNLGTPHYSSGSITTSIGAGGLGTRYSAAYGGSPALVYGSGYMIRAYVNANAWSGLTSFTMDVGGTAVLTEVDTGVAQSGTPWIISTTPTFKITKSGTDGIYKAQFRVYTESGTTPFWDSTMQGSYAGASTATFTFNGTGTSALIPGKTYKWDARYMKTSLTGPSGPYSTTGFFRVNAPPSVPTDLFPSSDHTYANTDTKFIRATFSDADISTMGDYPTSWVITIRKKDLSATYTSTVSSGLIVGNNETVWAGTALASDTDYEWSCYFVDSKSAVGSISAWTGFRISTPPHVTQGSVTPSNGSTINTTKPVISWTMTGGTQGRHKISITKTDSSGVEQGDGGYAGVWVISPVQSYTLPSGHIQDFEYYNIKILTRNTDGLTDNNPPVVNVRALLDAPPAVKGLVIQTYPSKSLVELEWATSALPSSQYTFVQYTIYAKLQNDIDWQYVGAQTSRTNPKYHHYYAGNGVNYQYRVTVSMDKATVGITLESPDDAVNGENMASAILESDSWTLVGEDRDINHIQEFIVDDESHTRPVQQESFETLGSNRKVIIRGFVLGNEGNINTVWVNEDVTSNDDSTVLYNHTVIGRRIVDYITFNRGPHILKSPFGDVWDVEFSAPTMTWQPGGHLNVGLTWVETGQTSQVSI